MTPAASRPTLARRAPWVTGWSLEAQDGQGVATIGFPQLVGVEDAS